MTRLLASDGRTSAISRRVRMRIVVWIRDMDFNISIFEYLSNSWLLDGCLAATWQLLDIRGPEVGAALAAGAVEDEVDRLAVGGDLGRQLAGGLRAQR